MTLMVSWPSTWLLLLARLVLSAAIIKLLLRFYDPWSGRILIDGQVSEGEEAGMSASALLWHHPIAAQMHRAIGYLYVWRSRGHRTSGIAGIM
jgi:hypothetical protein